jgi:hypothetical protein
MTQGVKGTARCGTPSGWTKHKNADETPCDACALAKKEYNQRWRSAPEKVRKNRLHAQAQARAVGRLKAIYPDLYAALYAEEKDRVWRAAGMQPEAVRSW